uniref:Transporter n=1 Tax=Pelusios castaneus TaxID=367368 RepID=A0A8C8SBP7_9SAUR
MKLVPEQWSVEGVRQSDFPEQEMPPLTEMPGSPVQLNGVILQPDHLQSVSQPQLAFQIQPVTPDPAPGQARETWGGKYEFLLSCIGYCVGLGNVWRFPYLCYRNGGGAFLIPYFIMLLFTGLPLFLMELSLGQYGAAGPITVWKCCPLLKGIGLGMLLVSSLVSLYYNVIIAWTFYYLGMSFQSPLPWSCDAPRNAHLCQNTLGNSSRFSASEAFWNEQVLGVTHSSGLDDPGPVRWPLAICLLVAWIIIFLCMLKGIRSSGKVVYFTATFPYFVIIVLIIRGATLEGSIDGIRFYLTSDWSRLQSAQGHPGYCHRELLHQLLCWVRHLLRAGPHGLEEGRAGGGCGRFRPRAGLRGLPRSPRLVAWIFLLVRPLLPDDVHAGSGHPVREHGRHHHGHDGRVPGPAQLETENPLPGGALLRLLPAGPAAHHGGRHLLVHPHRRLQHQLRSHHHRPLHVHWRRLLLRSDPVLPGHRRHDLPLPALVQPRGALLQGVLGLHHAMPAAVHPLLHLPGDVPHAPALWRIRLPALGQGAGHLHGHTDLHPDPPLGARGHPQGVGDADGPVPKSHPPPELLAHGDRPRGGHRPALHHQPGGQRLRQPAPGEQRGLRGRAQNRALPQGGHRWLPSPGLAAALGLPSHKRGGRWRWPLGLGAGTALQETVLA